MVEKLNGLGVQGKVISVLCVEDREGEGGADEQRHSIAPSLRSFGTTDARIEKAEAASQKKKKQPSN